MNAPRHAAGRRTCGARSTTRVSGERRVRPTRAGRRRAAAAGAIPRNAVDLRHSFMGAYSIEAFLY